MRIKYKDQHRVGFWQDGLHRRFRFPFIARGALGDCGHMDILGIQINWLKDSPKGWSARRAVSFWGIVAVLFDDDKGGTLKTCYPRWRIKFFSVSTPKFRRASPY